MRSPTTPMILPFAAAFTSARTIAGILLLVSSIAGACDVDETRRETFRDDGCGAGREIGFGDAVCEYRGSWADGFSAAVVSATCDGSDDVVCEYSMECGWAVSSTGTCRDQCDPRDPTPVTHSVRITLPNGDTQCDPPNAKRNKKTCSDRLADQAVKDGLNSACWSRRETVVEENLICCVDKPKKKGPCAEDEPCAGSEESEGGSEAGDSGQSTDPSGGEPCPPGTEMVCDVASPDDAELACHCAVAS